MKKLLMTLTILAMSVVAFANETESVSASSLMASNSSNSTTVYEMLVYTTDVVDDLCNYFNGSWLDTGLNVYCKFGGDVYTCTAYKVVSVACGINGVVKLSLQGDYNEALKKALNTSTKIFNVKKENGEFIFTLG